MKKIKKTIVYLIGLIVLLLVTTVVINLPVFDEELLPEVAVIKNIKAEPFNENNAYPALIAINGPSGKTLKQTSEEVRIFLNQKIKQTGVDYLSEQEFNELLGKDHDKSWQKIYGSCRSRTDKKCMQKMYETLKTNPVNNFRLREQFTKYEELIEYKGINEAKQIDVDMPLLHLGVSTEINRVYLSDMLINQSNDTYLLFALKNLKFWRMVLKNGHLIITKMVSVASSFDSIHSLSEAIRQNQLSRFQLNKLQTDIKILSQDEINLGNTLEFEFKYAMKLFDLGVSDGTNGSLDEWLYQPQATHNTRYLYETKPLKKFSALSTAEFYQYMNSDQKEKDFSSPVSWSPSMLYNPSGKLLLSYSIPAYTDYIARIHDLNGMFYLLKLQIEIALKPNQAVKQVIASSQYTNPYTLKPMEYNQETHSIYFECMDKTSVCELDL